MSFSRSSSNSGSSIPTSRSSSVALDLMLRTFMNSTEFQSSNPRVWENISKLVPGTTPQQYLCSNHYLLQCCERWEELRSLTSNSVTGDYSELSAHGRPLSHRSHTQHRQMTKFVRKMLASSSSSHHNTVSLPSQTTDISLTSEQERLHGGLRNEKDGVQSIDQGGGRGGVGGRGTGGVEGGGKFVANFYQNVMSKECGKREERAGNEERCRTAERRHEERNSITNTDHEESKDNVERKEIPTDSYKQQQQQETSSNIKPSPSIESHDADMIVHVFDEQRKSKREFHCPRSVLVKEMRYFSEYLSSDSLLSEEVDISVHCDIPVFEWLMRYAKRGLYEGTRGEILDEPLEPPTLEPKTVVSILISSDFLKMDSLVEECIDYCHKNLSAILASPTNMGCISDKLKERLADRFTPLEIEAVIDKRDKLQSKLYIHQIQQLFSPIHTHPQCPANAATLYNCKHCGKLLTSELSSMLPCIDSRLDIQFKGQLVYCHERDKDWNVSTYLSSLQHTHNITPRYIYWRLWGIINWLKCSVCGQVFQCCDLDCCHYHPQPPLSGRSSTGPPVHICCGSLQADVSPFPLPQSGCCIKDHTILDSLSSSIFSLLLTHRDIICYKLPTNVPTANKPKTILNTPSTSTVQLNFLKNADMHGSTRKISKPNTVPSFTEAPTSHHRGRESNCCSEVTDDGKEKGHSEMILATRQRAMSEVSEMEEDEEKSEDRPRQLPPPPHSGYTSLRRTHRRDSSNKTCSNHRSSVRRRHASSTPAVVEYVWDSSKPQRWNQDRQRENDERRLSVLHDHMTCHQPSVITTPHITTTTDYSSSRDAMSYAGGIFSHLEAQFRAQQRARAIIQPPHNTLNSRFSGRKNELYKLK